MPDSDGEILEKPDNVAAEGSEPAGLPARSEGVSAEERSAGSSSGHEDWPASFETLPLLPYATIDRPSSDQTARPPRAASAFSRMAMAVTLGLVAATGLAVAYDHLQNARAWEIEASRNTALASHFAALASRIDSIEASRGHEELGELRKVLAEVRSSASSARDLSGALTQLASRVDRIEKEQGARLDRLADRIDHDAGARLADIAGRLDRLEKKPVAAVLSAPPSLPTTPKVLPVPKTDAVKADPPVSNEITGAIEKPKLRLRNYFIDEFRGDYALIEGPGGAQSVSQGDYIPGAGRVLRFERHGHDWAIVTSQGVIVNGDEPF